MSLPTPIHLGKFQPILHGDVVDRYIQVASPELDSGETVSSATFTVTDANGATVSSVVSNPTYDGGRVDFRITAPATVGTYTLTAVLTISDGQKITKTATLTIV